jgi:uncharacterized protein (DUF1778 family)
LVVRIGRDDRLIIEGAAAREGLSLSDFVRRILLAAARGHESIESTTMAGE